MKVKCPYCNNDFETSNLKKRKSILSKIVNKCASIFVDKSLDIATTTKIMDEDKANSIKTKTNIILDNSGTILKQTAKITNLTASASLLISEHRYIEAALVLEQLLQESKEANELAKNIHKSLKES